MGDRMCPQMHKYITEQQDLVEVSYHCYKRSEVVINKTKVEKPQNDNYNLVYHGN